MTDAGDSLERERKSVAQTTATMTARREPCLSERSVAERAKDAVIGAYGHRGNSASAAQKLTILIFIR